MSKYLSDQTSTKCRLRECWYQIIAILFCCCSAHVEGANDGVCAKVGLRLDQTAVMTRTAFRATLELSNNDPASSLTSVSARVEIRDINGQPANTRFAIETPTLERIDRVDGTGILAANTTAIIRWLLIPADDAAPVAATVYNVSGDFSYTLDGNQVRVPLQPIAITVHPDAVLDLTYFHQRDVFSDDPFTPEVEPAQPYSLVLQIKNSGAGAAKSLKISSGEPQIVSNDKGLLIDFALAGVALDGTNIGNTLALDFGRIEPGATKTAEWKFTSSLQGFFQDIRATFQHEDNLGDIRLSTIKSVSIHEMEHIVYAGYGFADGKPDYLVNDIADPNRFPETLYLSHGSTQTVQVAQQASTLGTPSIANPTAQLTATMPAGWTYLRVLDPSSGQLRLSRVQRSDGAEVPVGTNVWVTDRTFVGPGQSPIRERVIHLLDFNSSGNYTLTYAENTNVVTDSTAPSSSITSLPAQSPELFAVSWSGQDNAGGSGLTYFDIFVSSNGGPFQVWFQQTTLRGSMYAGTRGSTYAFYSLASDQAGNREQPPGGADAQSAVNLVNTAPVLTAIPAATIDEGETLNLTSSATDADVPANNLTFSLAPGAPPGMTINPNSGAISWATGEPQGPSTNVVTVRIADNGQPSLEDSKTFTVVVREVNRPPTLVAIPLLAATEGIPFGFLISASDPDVPANTLAFSLAGSPAGAAIQNSTGLLTWTPSEDQGGTTNWFNVIVTDNGGLSVTQLLAIVVNEGNTAPIISAIAQRTIDEETELVVSMSATDLDAPTNRLTFSLTSSAPSGSTIDAATGIFRWTPTETQGPLTNSIQIVVTDDGFPNLSNTQTVSIIVREVNAAPTLLPISNQVAYVLSSLRVTNVVIDPDIPTNRMNFRLAEGAPVGAKITTNSGVFTWTPGRTHAQSSNFFTVVVTDGGIPPLSATNSFSVTVPDYFELSLGGTALLAGQTGSVPLSMDASAGVTNISFVLLAPEARLTNFTVQLLAPGLASASLNPFGSDRSLVTLNAADLQQLSGSQVLANLRFSSVSNQESTFVPLGVQDVVAIQADGNPVPRTLANNGRVVVIGDASILEALAPTNGQLTVILYGIRDRNFTLESTTNLMNGGVWTPVLQSSSTNLFQVFDVSTTNGVIFFRAREDR